MTRHVFCGRTMLLIAATALMGTGLLVGPKGSNAERSSAPNSETPAYTGGLYTPSGLSGYADLHVHQFTNLALGGKWLYGRAWPDGTSGFSLPSTRAQMQTAIPRCGGNVPSQGAQHGGLDLGKATSFFGLVGLFAGFATNEAWGADTGLHAGRRHGVCKSDSILGLGYCRGYGGTNFGCRALTHSQCTTGVQSPCKTNWLGYCVDRSSGDGITAGPACALNTFDGTACYRPCYWDPNIVIGHVEDWEHDFTDRQTGNDIDHASWPSWDAVAHQQVYVDWLKQAYDGGLRLMIMSALNNETLCRLLPNGTPCDDLASVNAQIAEAKAMDNVGAYSFYEIVYTAAQARATTAAGRMAVILAVESSDIFNGNDPNGTLDDLYNNGVRTLQPMHQFNGKLGGVAFHDEVIAAMQTIKNITGQANFNSLCKSNGGSGSYAPCDAKNGNVNFKGLTKAGKSFIIEMMQLGMPIDISHMSEKTIAGVQTLTSATCNYPVYISHGHVRDLLERGSDFPAGTEYGWKAKNSHEKTVPDWVLNYLSNSGGLLGLRTGADYYDFPAYQQFLTLAGLGNAPIPAKGSIQINGSPKKRGGTEYHFAYAVDYLTRVKNVNVALGSDFNGLIEQMLFDDESLFKCPGTSAIDTQDCKMAGMAHIGKEYALMNQKLNATGLQNVSSYNSLRNNSADAYVQMWERATSIGAGHCCNPITVSQLETTTAYNGGAIWLTIDGTGFNALPTMSAKLRTYQGTADYACTGFQMISSTQATCLAPAGMPVGFYDMIVSNQSGYCDQSGVRTKAIFMTSDCVAPPGGLVDWWSFDEISGTTAQDIRGLTNNVGVYVNGPTAVQGIVSGALSFDGEDDFVEVANGPEVNFLGSCTLVSDPPPDAEPMTIGVWVKTNLPVEQLGPNSGLQTILDKRVNPSNPSGYSLFLFNGRVGFQINGANFVAPASGPNVADNLWHFVAVSLRRCSSEGGQLYVDGNPVMSTPGTNGFINTAKLFIGQRNPAFGSNFLTGALDELEIFKRALTDDEIRALFEARSTGQCLRQPCPKITISPLVHQTWSAGKEYTPLKLTATSGTGPYTFSTKNVGFLFEPIYNLLPLTMVLDPDGTLHGKPIFPGTYTFSVTVADANGCFGTREYQLVIRDCSPIVFNHAGSVPTARINTPYSQILSATNSCALSFTWIVTSGALPIGFTLTPGGVLSGIAKETGDFTFTVTAADDFGLHASQTYTLKVEDPRFRNSGIIISEFRLDGPNGIGDEFVEIVNNTSTPKTIVSSDAGGRKGFSVWGIVQGHADQTGIIVGHTDAGGIVAQKICTIPFNTLLGPGQHYLCARVTPENVSGYGFGSFAQPDFNTFTLQPGSNLAVDGGIALFSSEDMVINGDGTFFSVLGDVFREDAVGFKKKNSDTFDLSFASAFREGAGLNPIGPQDPLSRSFQIHSAVREYSFVRKHQIAANGVWAGPLYNDSNNNAVDFQLVSNIGDFNSFPAEMDSALVQSLYAGLSFDPSPAGFPGTEAATTPVFGAPGPQNLASPLERNFNTQFLRSAFDRGSSINVSPNRERNSQIVCGSSRGDLILRFTYKNNTGLAQSNLRIRWIDISTFTRNNPNFTSIIELLDSTQATRRIFVNNGRDINTGTSAGAIGAQNDPPSAPTDRSGGNPANDGIVNARPAGGAGEKVVRGTYVEGVNKTPTVFYNGGSFPHFGFAFQNFRQVNPTEADLSGNPGTPCRVGGLNSATVATPPALGPSQTINAGITIPNLPATLPIGGSISLEHRFGVIKEGQFLIVGIIESN